MNAIMKAVTPQICAKIVNGDCLVLISKCAIKYKTPFKCYIYCTKGNEMLWILKKKYRKGIKNIAQIFTAKDCGGANKCNGKVIGEFVCDKIDADDLYGNIECGKYWEKATCLTQRELIQYGDYNRLYFWHISDLKIYDKPKELGEFFRPVKYDDDGPICGTAQEMEDIYEWDCETVFNKEYTECTLEECPQLQKIYRITRPPRPLCYVEELTT